MMDSILIEAGLSPILIRCMFIAGVAEPELEPALSGPTGAGAMKMLRLQTKLSKFLNFVFRFGISIKFSLFWYRTHFDLIEHLMFFTKYLFLASQKIRNLCLFQIEDKIETNSTNTKILFFQIRLFRISFFMLYFAILSLDLE